MARNLFWTHLRRFFLQLLVVCESGPPIFSLFRLCISSYTACRLCSRWHLWWCMQSGRWFSGLIGSWDLNYVRKIGTSFASCCLHIKVPGWLSDLNALLTRKLFLSRLNETSGVRGNMCFVSGSLRRMLKFCKMFQCGLGSIPDLTLYWSWIWWFCTLLWGFFSTGSRVFLSANQRFILIWFSLICSLPKK